MKGWTELYGTDLHGDAITADGRRAVIVPNRARRENQLLICKTLDVPPWVCFPEFKPPRFRRIRWRLRKIWSVWS